MRQVIAMGWESSDRRSRLPADWPKRRAQALKRDGHRCTWIDVVEGKRTRCAEPATDVDHHVRGDDHDLENLRSLCSEHHKRKTQREAHAGLAKARREIRGRYRRPTEEHPAYTFMKTRMPAEDG